MEQVAGVGRWRITSVAGAAIGSDPWAPGSWSGSSARFHRALRDRGRLERALGVRPPRPTRALDLLRTVRPRGDAWRNNLYLDTRYRDHLTRAASTALGAPVPGRVHLQLGGYYDLPSVLPGSATVFAYYDGNLPLRLASPYPLVGASARAVRRALDYEQRVLDGVSGVLTMSESLRRSFVEAFSLDPAKVHTIGGGVNLDELPPERTPQDLAALRTGRHLLFIGKDFARKGGPVLLDAFARVLRVHPGAHLHLVGPDGVSVPTALRGRVTVHGFLPRGGEELTSLFERCSVFVMPSIFEPFGIAPLEAMLHQVPAVVTDGWALGEMVLAGVTGELCPVGDAVRLAELLTGLLDDPVRAAALGGAGRRHVLANYTWDRVVDRLEAVVDSHLA